MHRLQCDICGAKSGAVDKPAEMTSREKQMIAEFRAEHDFCTKGDKLHYPEGCVNPVVPVVHGGAFGSEKPVVISTPKPHGHFERTGPYGELETGDTLSCCHCGAHWEVRAGSEKVRGFCAQCFNGDHGSGHTCGRLACATHVPKEQRLENVESGKDMLTPGIPKILVPRSIGDNDNGGHKCIEIATASSN